MSLAKSGNKNPLYSKKHNNETNSLMRNKKLKTFPKASESTKEKITMANGQAVYLYKLDTSLTSASSTSSKKKQAQQQYDNRIKEKEICNNFVLIKKFNSIRELGKFFNVSHSTISRYLKSGKIFKNCYKISITLLNE